MNRFYLFLALFFPAFVFAQASPNYVPAQVHRVTSVASASSSYITVNAIGKGFAANDPFRPVQAKVTPAKLLKFAKSNGGNLFRVNPWWLAASVALGYVFSEEHNSIVKETTQLMDSPPGFRVFYPSFCSSSPSFSALEACIKADGSFYGWSVYDSEYKWKNGLMRRRYHYKPNDTYHSYIREAGVQWDYSKDSNEVIHTPVPDDEFIDKIVPYIAQNPSPDIFGDNPTEVEFEPLEYNPFADNPYGAGLMELYRQGLLQSSDPNADYYVTPEQYQDIADRVAAQDRAKSPEGQADAMTDAATRPLTRPDLAEELATNRDLAEERMTNAGKQFTDATNAAGAPASITDKKTELDDFLGGIPDLVGGDIPGTPGGIAGVPLPVGWATGMNGSCVPLAVDISIGPFSHTTAWDAHCAPYDAIFRPVIEWFLMILTGLYLFRLWDDTVAKVAGM